MVVQNISNSIDSASRKEKLKCSKQMFECSKIENQNKTCDANVKIAFGKGIYQNKLNYNLAYINDKVCINKIKMVFLTNILLKRVKSKKILVLMESAVSGHQFIVRRERLADKLEFIKFDPYLQAMSVYKERRKIRSA